MKEDFEMVLFVCISVCERLHRDREHHQVYCFGKLVDFRRARRKMFVRFSDDDILNYNMVWNSLIL
jgi:hypothetical protein